jgi:RNA recognition motif-containing protein
MSSDDEAKAAIEGLAGKELAGRAIVVNEARPRR